MQKKLTTITGVILAGGKSSRMGQDKGLLEWKGKKFVEIILKPLQAVFSKVIVVANQPGYKFLKVEVIPDRIAGLGPAGGILTAIQNSNQDCFITGCDMPLLNEETIRKLLDVRNPGDDAVVFKKEENIYPLPGFYSYSALNVFQEEIHRKNLKLQSILEKMKTNYIDFPSNEFSSSDLTLFNVNSPEDLEALKKLANES